MAQRERALGSRQDDDGVEAGGVKRLAGMALRCDQCALLAQEKASAHVEGVAKEKTSLTRSTPGNLMESILGEMLLTWK